MNYLKRILSLLLIFNFIYTADIYPYNSLSATSSLRPPLVGSKIRDNTVEIVLGGDKDVQVREELLGRLIELNLVTTIRGALRCVHPDMDNYLFNKSNDEEVIRDLEDAAKARERLLAKTEELRRELGELKKELREHPTAISINTVSLIHEHLAEFTKSLGEALALPLNFHYSSFEKPVHELQIELENYLSKNGGAKAGRIDLQEKSVKYLLGAGEKIGLITGVLTSLSDKNMRDLLIRYPPLAAAPAPKLRSAGPVIRRRIDDTRNKAPARRDITDKAVSVPEAIIDSAALYHKLVYLRDNLPEPSDLAKAGVTKDLIKFQRMLQEAFGEQGELELDKTIKKLIAATIPAGFSEHVDITINLFNDAISSLETALKYGVETLRLTIPGSITTLESLKGNDNLISPSPQLEEANRSKIEKMRSIFGQVSKFPIIIGDIRELADRVYQDTGLMLSGLEKGVPANPKGILTKMKIIEKWLNENYSTTSQYGPVEKIGIPLSSADASL